MRNFSPSRIPLATSKISFVSRNKPNDAPGKARAGDPSNHDNESHLEDNNSIEIKVNVAALIATHQEKQQQSIGSTTAAQPLKGASTYQREHADNNGIVSAQKDEATSEPIVSVSDKCQQFEQRIRKNSIDSSVNTITQRKPYNSSASLDESQPKPGTTNNGIYGQVYCDAVNADNGSFSGADLLHEIDHALVLAKDFLFSRGMFNVCPFSPPLMICICKELYPYTHLMPCCLPRLIPDDVDLLMHLNNACVM